MSWLARLNRWLGGSGGFEVPPPPIPPLMPTSGAQVAPSMVDPQFNFGVIEALNGTLIQIGKHKPQQYGPDWTYTLYIVPEGQALSDALAACVLIAKS